MRMRRRSGQALVELAVFGAIALAALGFLIRVGMRMNYDQEIRMAAFRRSLAAARADNGTWQDALGTLFHQIADRQMPNPSDGFLTLPRTRTEASGFAEWGDRLTFAYDIDEGDRGRLTQPLYVVRSNNTEQRFRADDFPRDINFRIGRIGVYIDAFESITREASTKNRSNATITQNNTSSGVASNTRTTSSTTVNTRPGVDGRVPSSVSSGTSVSW